MRLNIYCISCKKSYTANYFEEEVYIKNNGYGDREFVECLFCGSDGKVEGTPCAVFAKPVIMAIYEHKGKPIAVDKKGNVVENNYYSNDSRGWKYAGFKDTRGYERSVIMR